MHVLILPNKCQLKVPNFVFAISEQYFLNINDGIALTKKSTHKNNQQAKAFCIRLFEGQMHTIFV